MQGKHGRQPIRMIESLEAGFHPMCNFRRLWIRGLAGVMSTMGRKDAEDLMAEYRAIGGVDDDNKVA